MKRRRWHRWLGVLCVAGITIASVTGVFLNHPDWIDQPDHVQQATPDESGLYVLTESQLWYVSSGVRSKVRLRHPIRPGDRLVARQSGVAILHRDHALMVYQDGIWDRVRLPDTMGWITHVDAVGVRWTITTTTGVWLSADDGRTWQLVNGPYPESTRDRIKKWHSGWIGGQWGSYAMSATAIATVVLSITGLLLLKKRRKKKHPKSNHEDKSSQ